MEESDTGSEQHFHFLVHKSFNEEPEKTQKKTQKKKKKSLTINQLSLIAYSKLYCHFLLTIMLNNKQIMYTGLGTFQELK